MERRTFLKAATGGVAAMAAAQGLPALPQERIASKDAFPPDGYQAPSWLRYARAVCFDGYSPPLNPHMKDFDAKRLVECVLAAGGDTLRFQPIGYWAYYPSKAYPRHAELGTRDLIDEVSRECRRERLHLYCYTAYGHPFLEVGWVDRHPEYADWVRCDPWKSTFREPLNES